VVPEAQAAAVARLAQADSLARLAPAVPEVPQARLAHQAWAV